MAYIDGFVAAVPVANREVYREHAARMAEINEALRGNPCVQA